MIVDYKVANAVKQWGIYAKDYWDWELATVSPKPQTSGYHVSYRTSDIKKSTFLKPFGTEAHLDTTLENLINKVRARTVVLTASNIPVDVCNEFEVVACSAIQEWFPSPDAALEIYSSSDIMQGCEIQAPLDGKEFSFSLYLSDGVLRDPSKWETSMTIPWFQEISSAYRASRDYAYFYTCRGHYFVLFYTGASKYALIDDRGYVYILRAERKEARQGLRIALKRSYETYSRY